MPKKEDGYVISETGNWNVANDFARLKIMKPLYLSDEYANIAIFGTSSIIEELTTNLEFSIDSLRITGFRRLVECLILLIDNSLFAMKMGGDDKLKEYKEELKKVKKSIPKLYNNIIDQENNTNRISLNSKMYELVLDRVLHLKSSINVPLNKNHLIFTDREQFDPKAFKERILQDAIERG